MRRIVSTAREMRPRPRLRGTSGSPPHGTTRSVFLSPTCGTSTRHGGSKNPGPPLRGNHERLAHRTDHRDAPRFACGFSQRTHDAARERILHEVERAPASWETVYACC